MKISASTVPALKAGRGLKDAVNKKLVYNLNEKYKG